MVSDHFPRWGVQSVCTIHSAPFEHMTPCVRVVCAVLHPTQPIIGDHSVRLVF